MFFIPVLKSKAQNIHHLFRGSEKNSKIIPNYSETYQEQ